MADMMKRMTGMGMRDRMRAMQEMTQSGMLNPGGKLSKQKIGTGKRLTPAERAKLKKERERELRRKKREQRKK
jgi:signal recognition particle subunit SRP54